VPLADIVLPDSGGKRFALARDNDEFFAACDPRVEKVALEEKEMLHSQRDDHRREF
jgi:hypothetical protein